MRIDVAVEGRNYGFEVTQTTLEMVSCERTHKMLSVVVDDNTYVFRLNAPCTGGLVLVNDEPFNGKAPTGATLKFVKYPGENEEATIPLGTIV